LPIPGDELKLPGEIWGEDDDVVTWLMRMAFPKNETEFKEYLDLAEKNEIIKIMRVTAPKEYKEQKDWDLFSRPVLQSRLTGELERSKEYSNQDLKNGMIKL
jgi:hypothetical protein